jgi:8-amino-7-oxononanoate synthase
MTKSIRAHIDSKLTQRKEAGMLRRLVNVDGLIDFCSNDYLGYAQNTEDFKNTELLAGSTGSRLLSGNTKYAEDLEAFIADYHLAHQD